MSEKILVPDLGETITDATVAKWLKNIGDPVEADDPIVELETDKVNLEVPSPIAGVLKEIASKDGSVVKVGAFLGSISDNKANVSVKEVKNTRNENNVIKLDASKKEPKIFEEKSNREKPLILTDEEEKPLILRDQILEENLTDQKKDNQALSPAVRKIVTENKIDIDSVKGSGKDGRILKGDLISLMGVNPNPSERKVQYGQEERIKMTRLRQPIAKRLKQPQ